MEEALEQLQRDPKMSKANETMKTDRILLATVREAYQAMSKLSAVEKEGPLDQLTPFVSWDLKNNQPKMVIDFGASYLETLWMA